MDHFDRWRGLGSAASLRGNVGVALVFVDDPGADAAWSVHDRETIERKFTSAARWLEGEAKRHAIALSVSCRALPRTGVAERCLLTIDANDPCAGPHHATWQNMIAWTLFSRSPSLSAAWPQIAALFDAPPDSLSVLFAVRRLHLCSCAFPFEEGAHDEFRYERGIIYDMGANGQVHADSLLAHEFLHLHGAIDLRPETLQDEPPTETAAVLEAIRANAPSNDIMHTPTQMPIAAYTVGPLTAYLIGWIDQLPTWFPPCSRGP